VDKARDQLWQSDKPTTSEQVAGLIERYHAQTKEILDRYFGQVPTSFDYQGHTYTPWTFRQSVAGDFLHTMDSFAWAVKGPKVHPGMTGTKIADL
jgi:hypothetical protein